MKHTRPARQAASSAALALILGSSLAAFQPAATPPPTTQPPPTPPKPATSQPAQPPASSPALPPASSAAPGDMGPPRLPPFAGDVVSFDRRGARVVACVDRANVRTSRPGAPAAPEGPKLPPAYRIWLIEREVMQELMTTGGLCDPVWSPDGKSFLAAGARGLFTFTEPQYEARVLMVLPPAPPPVQPSGPAAGAAIVKSTDAAPIPFTQTSWSPGGKRVAFLLTKDGATKVRVVDAKDGSSLFSRDQPAKIVQWGADERTLVVDGTRVPLP
jgi:hypothetical protein